MPPSQSDARTVDPAEDDAAVATMLGREPRGSVVVAVRCHLGLPAVIEVDPILPGGEPFPTLYWLTCPLAVKRVGRLEGDGMIRSLEARVDVSAADAEYAQRRRARLAALVTAGAIPPGSVEPAGGVSGAKGGVKCLHGRLAYWLAGGDDPAGAETSALVAPLDCTAPCVGGDNGDPQISAPLAVMPRGGAGIGRADVFVAARGPT